MATDIRRTLKFSQGANTTALGVTSDPEWRQFDESLVDHAAAQRRLGKSRVYAFTPTSTIVDFDGTNDVLTLPYDSRVWQLHTMSAFTLKGMCVADSYAAVRPIFFKGTDATHFNISIFMDSTSSGRIACTLRDSGGTNTTLVGATGITAGTTVAWMLTLSGGTFTFYANGTSASGTLGTGTLQGANTDVLLGSDNLTLLDGGIDHVTLLSTVETTQRGNWCRQLNPRAENVLADYVITLDANGYFLDRSLFENHGSSAGSPATNRACLCKNPDPVGALALNLDTSGRRQLYAAVGDRVYPVRV